MNSILGIKTLPRTVLFCRICGIQLLHQYAYELHLITTHPSTVSIVDGIWEHGVKKAAMQSNSLQHMGNVEIRSDDGLECILFG
jgi:hypothetical protein